MFNSIRRSEARTGRLLIFSFGLLALLVAFTQSVWAQQLSGIRSPVEKKELAGQELSAGARATRGEAPLNRLYDHLKVLPSKVRRLPAMAAREVQDAGSEKRLRIGEVRAFSRPVKVSSDSTLYRVVEGDVRVMGVVTEGARYTRVHFTGMSLPAGARVFVYSLENPEEFYGPYEGMGPSGDGAFWTPPMEGEGVAIEYFTPDGADDSAAAPFQVSEVSHIFSDPLARAGANEDFAANGTAGACNLEVTNEWAEVAKSVGNLQFTSGGGEYLCTGTLLNNQANNFTPYLLTANHCFNTQVEAQTLRVYWNYLSGDTPPASTPRTDGATLLATGTASDFTFVVLTGALPGGLYFSGWDATTQISASTPLTGIHHPQGSHKRISFGATNSSCVSGLPGPCSNFTGVTWSSGTTEGGSSGSGIWTGSAANPQFVGTLYGGGASCATPKASDYYGRFSITYPKIAPFLMTTTGTSCVSSITTPSSQYFPNSGGAGSISVTAPEGCNWNVAASHSFVNITSGASGSGNGTVTFSVQPNGGVYRAAVIVVGSRVFTVAQADVSNPLPGVSINDVSYIEGDFDLSAATATLSLSAPSSNSVTVHLKTIANTAMDSGVDFYPAGFYIITFAPGETTKTFTIPIVGDLNIEPDETFFIDITSASNALVSRSRATFTIVNDDVVPTVALSINDVSVTEGNTGTTPATFTVTLSAPTAKTVKVSYGSVMVTVGFEDFQYQGGTLTFAPGQTTQTITVPIIGDTVAEGNETFKIVLRDPINALLADAEGVCTIVDDEAAPTLSIDNITIVEGNVGQKTAIFTVSLSPKTNQQVSVNYTTSPGTATENKDYMKSSGAILFGPQGTTKTISVPINGDLEYEGDETFFLTLSDSSGATISKAQGVCTITNDDAPQLPLQLMLDESATEPNQAAAIDSMLFLRDQFPVVNPANLLHKTADKNTRVIIFVMNLPVLAGQSPSTIVVTLTNNNQTYDIGGEYATLVPGLGFTQLTFRLPDNLQPGPATIKVKAHGLESNTATIRIKD